MIVNGATLLEARPIIGMESTKIQQFGVSHGLGEAGYDIRIKQEIVFKADQPTPTIFSDGKVSRGRFVIASAIEEFCMPEYLVAIVHDKSTWARQGVSVFNTVIEPGWCGFLTLEIVFHGSQDIAIPAGAGIAQVLFHSATDFAKYEGKYQNQADAPIPARML